MNRFEIIWCKCFWREREISFQFSKPWKKKLEKCVKEATSRISWQWESVYKLEIYGSGRYMDASKDKIVENLILGDQAYHATFYLFIQTI